MPTILLVEDNPITAKMVRFALENRGFTVLTAPDGATAISHFTAKAVDLVLQDLVLPDMDGFDLVGRLRSLARGSEVPILAFSGMLSAGDEARLAAVGFDDFITKPVEPSRLLQIVRSHLATDDATASPTFGRGARVVLVDDDPVQRKLAALRLARVGFDVIQAADGREALEKLADSGVAAVVSDVLMPGLDGFGLCIEVRRSPTHASIPVLLVTNSYLDSSDRDLALQAGANDLVLRTPDLKAVLESLRTLLQSPSARPAPVGPRDESVERERARALLRQLDRQVALNAGAARRCALLSAEIAVLTGISEALATHDDIEDALRHALAACFDAGGISVGVLYLRQNGELRAIGVGSAAAWSMDELLDLLGDRATLEALIADRDVIFLPRSSRLPEDAQQTALRRSGARSGLFIPLLFRGSDLGALLMMSKADVLEDRDHALFAQAVAGQISHALALARAFADRAASEAHAQEQAAVLRSILDSTADGVVVADRSGQIIHWNAAADHIMRMGRQDGPAEEWSTAYGLYEADRVTPLPLERAPLYRAIHGEDIDGMEIFVRHAGAPEGVWLDVNARPWRDESGEVRGGVAALRDVTQEKNVQAQLIVSDRMASVGMLAAGVAHEINNPLAAVMAYLDLARADMTEANEAGFTPNLEELAEMLDDARAAADRVRKIVRDLRIFSRHEEVTTGAVDIHRVLESSLRMAWNEIRHRARLSKDLAKVPPVLGTESRLGQVFLNLIVNAAQAIPPGDVDSNSIGIATRETGGTVTVTVSDTGGGIPAQALPRLFTPFFTTKEAGVGTGLGLAICHRIVTELGGTISVRSKVDEGTTFTVVLPAAHTGESREEVGRAAVPSAPRRGRVLVVDDEAPLLAALARLLRKEHDVITTTTGADTLARIRSGETFDAVLCDLMMPQVTGMDVYEQLRVAGDPHADRIVFVTGGAFTETARAFLARIDNPTLEKPVDVDRLRAVVNALVR